VWYVHNQWYDISCATLYIRLLFVHWMTFVNTLQVVVSWCTNFKADFRL